MLGISGLVVERLTIQVAYRAAKAFRATGSMEWMHQTEGVQIFGACNANLGRISNFCLAVLVVCAFRLR